MVTLVGPDGGEEERVIARLGDGFFLLHAPSVGEYRLRADRIGYRATYSDPFFLAPGDTLVVGLEANIEPVSLAGIEAEAGRRCRVRPEEGLAVSRVWEEARTSPGGRVDFTSLPNGTWIVTSWHVRMFLPRVTDLVSVFRLVTLEGIREERGKVLRVLGDEGVVYRGDLGYRVAGTVLDTLGVGLPNARVFIEGSGAEATVDAQGRFELAHLEPGEYVLHFGHRYLDQLWYRPRPETVRVREDDRVPAEVEFRAPTLERVFDRICDGKQPASEPQKGLRMHGIVMGQASDDLGHAVAGAQVLVLARAQTDEDRNPAEWVSVAAVTSPSGFYRACWVPVGVPLSVVVLHEDEDFHLEDLVGSTTPADLLPGRLQEITIAPEQPYQTVQLVRGPEISR